MGKDKPRNYVVIGLGTFGATIATELTRLENYVLGIDRDASTVNQYADEISQTACADGRDEKAMEELSLGDYDVALIAMGDLESSIVSAINAKMDGVKQVWAKANSKTHHRILSKVGVDRVFYPEVAMGQHIAQMLHNPMVRDYVNVGNNFLVVSIEVPEWLAGESLESLALKEKFDLQAVAVMEGRKLKSDGEDCRLEKDDYLLLLGESGSLRKFSDAVSDRA